MQKINSVHFSTISRFIFLLPFPGLFFFFQDCDVNIVFVVTVRPGECRWDRRRLFRKSAGGLEVECRPYNNHYSAEMAIWRRLSVPRPETPWLDFPRVAILPRLRVLPFHWSPIPATFSHPHCTSTSNPKRMCRLEKSPSHAQKRSVLFFFSLFLFFLASFFLRLQKKSTLLCIKRECSIQNRRMPTIFRNFLSHTGSIVSRLVCEQFAGREFKEPLQPSLLPDCTFRGASEQSAVFICFSHVYHSATAEPLILSLLSFFICLLPLCPAGGGRENLGAVSPPAVRLSH